MRRVGATGTCTRDKHEDGPDDTYMRVLSEPDNMEVHPVCNQEQTEPRSPGKQAVRHEPESGRGCGSGAGFRGVRDRKGQPESQSGPEYPACSKRRARVARWSHQPLEDNSRETPARTNRSSEHCSRTEQESRSANQTREPTGRTRGQGVRRARRTLPRRCRSRTRFADSRNRRRLIED